jgi:APA family basic amino acid/polyamine antiporter
MFGFLCGDMLSTPRSWYALARDGFLPGPLTRIHPIHRTPSLAIWTHAVLVLVLASTNTFEGLAIVANVALLGLYLLCCAAALQLTRRDTRVEASTPFAMRGATVFPIAAAALMLWILSTATPREIAVTALVLAVATLMYVVQKQRQSTER